MNDTIMPREIDPRDYHEVYDPASRTDGAKLFVVTVPKDDAPDIPEHIMVDYLITEWFELVADNGRAVSDQPTVHVVTHTPSGLYKPMLVAVGWAIPA